MISILSFTDKGDSLADQLSVKLGAKSYKNSEKKIKDQMGEIWAKSRAIIFISACGIAVRYIAPFIVHKKSDPAVLVVDDTGKFVISLLSGHLGGANDLARDLSSFLDNSIAVITTASDNRGFESLDNFAKKNGLKIESFEALRKILGLMVNGEEIGLYSEIKERPDYEKIKYLNLEESLNYKGKGFVNISDKLILNKSCTLNLVPKDLYLGIGCKRGKSKDEILDLIDQSFDRLKLNKLAIKKIGSIDLKKDELGLIETVKDLGVEIEFFTSDQLSQFDDLFPKSDFVKKIVGVTNVCQSSAHIMTKNVITEKICKNGVTLAIGRKIDG